jgi:sec-independent protein translocase protein TatB
MFDIGWSELMVIGAVALVVIGPKDLPAAFRQAGKWMGAVRRIASDFQGQVNAAMRDAELDELRREMRSMKDDIDGLGEPVPGGMTEPRALPAPAPVKTTKPKRAAATKKSAAKKPAVKKPKAKT